MRHVFWIEEGTVAGRRGPWQATFDLAAMEAAGIGAILTLDAEEAELLPPLPAEGAPGGGIVGKCIHLTPNIPPGPEDYRLYAERVPEALSFLLDWVENRKGAVLVHCHAGNDRTGTVLAAWICATRGKSPVDAIEEVRIANPEALSAYGYEEMALEVLNGIFSR
jgi:hypothetical protein